MSVINRVLKDLDRQGRTPGPALPGIRVPTSHAPAHAPALRRAWRAGGMALAALALVSALWWAWPDTPGGTPPPPSAPVSAPTNVVTRPAPATADVVNDTPVHAPSPEPLAAQTTAPPPAARPSLPPAPAVAPAAPTRATPPSPRQAMTHFSVASRLERRLPEIPVARASLPPPLPAASKAQINKEERPLSPADQAEDLWRQGRRLQEQGQIHAAQSRYEQALRGDANHLRARQSLAVACLESGQRGKAEEVLREGVTRHPGESWFLRSLAQMQIQQGDYAHAAEVLKTGLAHDKSGKSGEAADWALYASTLGKLGRTEASLQAYREALHRDPGQGAWWIGLGVAQEQTGHRAEAADAYARALHNPLSGELKEFATQKVQEIGQGPY